MKLFSKFSRYVVGGVVAVPLVTFGGLSAYVQYRARTKPKDYIFVPLVDNEGNLLLEGVHIAKPSTLTLLWRAIELWFIFAPVAVMYIFLCWSKEGYDKWLSLLVAAVERAGPAFVKAGQWSCTRHDIFSPEFRNTFKRLYSEVQIHPFSDSLAIIASELKKDPYEVFSSIEEKCVGSGSIGQVHEATLRSTGERVVIKVMHPDVVETIVKDFNLIKKVAYWVDHWFGSSKLCNYPATANAWTNHLAAQLDFRIEAEHLERFRENFKSESFVDFPRPIMSSQKILVESYCPGVPATPEFLSSQEEHVRDILAHKGLNTWCKMLLRDNFIHGDMHPGNILIDVSNRHDPRVTLIDVGLCQKISPEEGVVTHDLMESFVRWDYKLCVSSIMRMGNTQPNVDPVRFDTDMEFLFDHWRPRRGEDQVVSNILQGIFDAIRENHVYMEPPYVSLLFAVLVLEAFIMNLNPEFDMVRHTAPWLLSEGHFSLPLVKNLCLTQVDVARQEFNAARGRVTDYWTGTKHEYASNVRLSNA